MKNLKIKLAMIAIVFGFGAAFATKAPVNHHAANQYWSYNGTGDPTQPSSYTETTGDPCSGSNSVCEILAPANGSQPQISGALATRIENLDTSDHDVFLKN